MKVREWPLHIKLSTAILQGRQAHVFVCLDTVAIMQPTLHTPPQCIWNLLSSIPSARFLLTGKYRGSIIFITKACGSPLGASNSWRDDQGGKRLNYIHCYFNINILWFFAQACMVYLTILLTKVSQMERAELDMLGTLFTVRRQWKEDSWHFTGWEQLFCKAFTGLGFEKH